MAKGVRLGCECLELLDAMKAAETEVEDHDEGPTLIVGEREVLAGGIGKFPRRGWSGFPAEGAQGIEVGKGVFGGVVEGFNLGAPVLGQTQAFGDGSEASEDGGGEVDGLAEFTKLAEGLVGLLRFAGGVKQVSCLGGRKNRLRRFGH
mgnify:CR=1 FL=1